jgi:hypothetical protein
MSRIPLSSQLSSTIVLEDQESPTWINLRLCNASEALFVETFFLAIWLSGLKRWYLVQGGVPVGCGFEPHSDPELFSTKIIFLNGNVNSLM